MITTGALLLALATLFAFFPRLLVYPLILVFLWVAVALLYRGYKLRQEGKHEKSKREIAATITGERG